MENYVPIDVDNLPDIFDIQLAGEVFTFRVDYNSVADYWNNYYTDYYSGASKKKLDKYLKAAKANYQKAKTDSAKLQYLQQIRAIQARRGVIANK